ncbi:MAG: ABC transporter permease subunit [Bdellovibrionaceae bacterium]|nr:ABC transporter permease subunit [Pseudobdellovibrionaceae bacterium]
MQNKLLDIKKLQFLIVTFFISPFLILFFNLFQPHAIGNFDFEELFWSLKNTTIQACYSAFLSMVTGFFLSLGLLEVANRKKINTVVDFLFLLPNFLPNLFIVIGLMNLIDPFPMGILGIVLVHAFINFGFVGILIKNLIVEKLGRSGELALVLGVTRLSFIFKIIFPQLKYDFLRIYLYVFTISFSSFAIPLLVGGGKGTNLEVLIYEKLRINFDWSSALFIALFQSMILFLLSIGTMKTTRFQSRESFNLKVISSRNFLLVFALLYVLFFVQYVYSTLDGVNYINDFFLYKREIIKGIFGTLALSVGTGSLVSIFLLLVAFVWEKNYFSKFMLGYIGPSSALTALAFFVLGYNFSFLTFAKILLALVLIYSSLAYRLGWDSLLHDLESEKEKAQIMGADERLIFQKIILPRVIKRALFLGGMASFWAAGEFAISKILASSDFSVAMIVETFISQYRIGLASVLTFLVLLLGTVVFFIFVGVGDVLSKKIKNSL